MFNNIPKINPSRCQRRGHEWQLTFDQWYQWWLDQGMDKNYPENSDQLRPAGPNRGAMLRIKDDEPWSIHNIWVNNRPGTRGNPPPVNRANPRSRCVITPDGEFASASAAARYYGIRPASMWNRIQDRPQEYYYK